MTKSYCTKIHLTEKCGDGRCDINETCSSCYEDCKLMCGKFFNLKFFVILYLCFFFFSAPRTCKDSCSTHGRCDSGICICDREWSGPNCEGKF